MQSLRLILSMAVTLATCYVQARPLRILVGTYTENTPAEGVYLYNFDPLTAHSQLLSMAPSRNPSFVITSPDGSMAYAVNEFHDGREGVSSFVIDGNSISPLNSTRMPNEKVNGRDPCNILCTGKALVTSNYTGGTFSAFSISNEGLVGDLTQSFVPPQGKMAVHMHCAVISPDGKYIFGTNLGNDCIHRFDLLECDRPLGDVKTAWQHRGLEKFGPRHMVFSTDGKFAYLLCELGDRLVVFSYDNGELTPVQTLKAYKGKGRGSADIHLSPDGRFLYTSHRLKEDGIAIFSVNPQTGKVKRAGYQKTGIHPRNFAISPDGHWLLCACRDSNRIEVYSVNTKTGALTLMDKAIEVGAPVCIQFLP
ncbi:MAG: lactonase family protein [Bacteroidales bacterium]|nr:lactonase family protein [Bacteroidales bacterium]